MLLSQEYPLSYIKSTEEHTNVKSKSKATNKMVDSELLFDRNCSFSGQVLIGKLLRQFLIGKLLSKSAATVGKCDGRTHIFQDFRVSLYFWLFS